MKLASVKHHSLEDWDFDPKGAWHIDGTIYVSAPSSLSCYSSDTGGYRWCYLKPALVADLPDGRYVTWAYWRNLGVGHLDICFRTQALPTNNNGYPDNSYLLRLTDKIKVYRLEAGQPWGVLLDVTPPDPPQTGAWEHWRVTFWQYTDPSLNKILRIVIEKEVDEAWKEQGAVEDPDNLWAESGVNRIGHILQRVGTGQKTNLDDTEIWRRVD